MAFVARLVCVSFVLATLVGSSPPADAAPLISISYDVTGGSFQSSGLLGGDTGAITGGSVTYNAPAPSISTPTSCLGAGSCGSMIILLSGPSGAFTNTINVGFANINATNFVAGLFATFFPTASLSSQISTQVSAMTGTGYAKRLLYSLSLSTTVGTFSHSFTLGNEIRTFVPEPSTGTLMGLGLGLMGAVGARSATKRRRRARS